MDKQIFTGTKHPLEIKKTTLAEHIQYIVTEISPGIILHKTATKKIVKHKYETV